MIKHNKAKISKETNYVDVFPITVKCYAGLLGG